MPQQKFSKKKFLFQASSDGFETQIFSVTNVFLDLSFYKFAQFLDLEILDLAAVIAHSSTLKKPAKNTKRSGKIEWSLESLEVLQSNFCEKKFLFECFSALLRER